jgi:hypothetical protein
MSQLTATEFALAAKEILKVLDKAETSLTWNATLLAIREARRHVEELMILITGCVAADAGAPGAAHNVLIMTLAVSCPSDPIMRNATLEIHRPASTAAS